MHSSDSIAYTIVCILFDRDAIIEKINEFCRGSERFLCHKYASELLT